MAAAIFTEMSRHLQVDPGSRLKRVVAQRACRLAGAHGLLPICFRREEELTIEGLRFEALHANFSYASLPIEF